MQKLRQQLQFMIVTAEWFLPLVVIILLSMLVIMQVILPEWLWLCVAISAGYMIGRAMDWKANWRGGHRSSHTPNDFSPLDNKERLRMIELAARHSGSAIIMADARQPDQPLVYVNPAFTDITGHNEEEVLGKNCRFLQRQDNKQFGLYLLREAIRKGHPCRVLLRNYRKDGMLFWNDLHFSSIYDESGKLTHFLGMMHNVTELKNTQQMLELTNRQLTAKNTILETVKAQAEKAHAIKRDFLDNMSHEVRTPMNGIIGTVELLAETPLEATQRKYVDVLQRTAHSLLSVINDVLDYSKIEAGKIQLYETIFDPRDVLTETLALFSNTAKSKSLTLKTAFANNLPEAIVGDKERMRQIISNFANNALKFTAKGTITLSVEVVSRNRGDSLITLRFAVKDEGIGITQAQQAHIFKKFAQANACTSKHYGGTGLGLAICREMAELMGGKVGVKSKEGKGATFWFEVELVEKAELDILPFMPMAEEADRIRFKQADILLVEDNVVNQMIGEAQLKSLGLAVKVAENGEEAIKHYKKHAFDLVIMDVQMPVMSGLDAVVEMRKLELLENRTHTPVIAFTANVSAEYRQECLGKGMDDFLAKPFRKEALVKLLKHFLPTEGGEGKILADKPMQEQGIQTEKTQSSPIEIHKAQLDSLKEILGENLRPLVEEYFVIATKGIEEIRDSLEKADYHAISTVAHSLKSASQNIGATTVYEKMRCLEQEAIQHPEKVGHLLLETEQAFATIQSALRGYMAAQS